MRTDHDDMRTALGCFRGLWTAVRLELAVIAAFVSVSSLYYWIGRAMQ